MVNCNALCLVTKQFVLLYGSCIFKNKQDEEYTCEFKDI